MDIRQVTTADVEGKLMCNYLCKLVLMRNWDQRLGGSLLEYFCQETAFLEGGDQSIFITSWKFAIHKGKVNYISDRGNKNVQNVLRNVRTGLKSHCFEAEDLITFAMSYSLMVLKRVRFSESLSYFFQLCWWYCFPILWSIYWGHVIMSCFFFFFFFFLNILFSIYNTKIYNVMFFEAWVDNAGPPGWTHSCSHFPSEPNTIFCLSGAWLFRMSSKVSKYWCDSIETVLMGCLTRSELRMSSMFSLWILRNLM